MEESQSSTTASAITHAAMANADCHILPCKIQYSGPAPVDVYFQPTPIPQTKPKRCITVSNEDYKNFLNGSIRPTTSAPPDIRPGDDPPTLQAAHFRGRGLMATYPPAPVHACVLHLNTSASPQKSVVAVVEKQAIVKTISEWQHEHLESAVLRTQRNGATRVARGLEYCRIAAALHEPLAAPAPTADQ
jgi:Ribonuclease H2 non-catalytic subunit (Ylr154p-like)